MCLIIMKSTKMSLEGTAAAVPVAHQAGEDVHARDEVLRVAQALEDGKDVLDNILQFSNMRSEGAGAVPGENHIQML